MSCAPRAAAVTTTRDLVALLYRIDVTQRSLSARITWRATDESRSDWLATDRQILVAPGGRYRVTGQEDDVEQICDGEYRWNIEEGTAFREPAPAAPPGSVFSGFPTPPWPRATYQIDFSSPTP